jgi:hypothetical protein
MMAKDNRAGTDQRHRRSRDHANATNATLAPCCAQDKNTANDYRTTAQEDVGMAVRSCSCSRPTRANRCS